MASIAGIDLQYIILIIIVVLVLSLIFFRRYFSALIYDYVVDGGLSFLDEPFGGIAMFDWGDWIAAVIIFLKYKKIVGVGIALILVLEAANFIPGLDYITNLFPAVTIAMLLFNKFKPAEKKEKKLEEEISIAEEAGINVGKQKKVLKDIKKLIKKSNPVGALKEFRSKKPIKKVSSQIRTYVDGLISDANNVIQYIVKQNIQAPQDMIDELQKGINEAGELLQQAYAAENDKKNPDFNAAINLSKQAKDVIYNAAYRFDDEFRNYQPPLQPRYAQ